MYVCGGAVYDLGGLEGTSKGLLQLILILIRVLYKKMRRIVAVSRGGILRNVTNSSKRIIMYMYYCTLYIYTRTYTPTHTQTVQSFELCTKRKKKNVQEK